VKRTSIREVAAFRAAKIKPGEFNPAEVVICPWGTVQTRKGPVTVNEHTLAVFDANQKAARRDAVAADFNHNTLLGKEPCKVAGYFSVRVEKGRGIIAEMNHETPDMQLVKDGHYPDISPAVFRNESGVVEELHSFAFCRHGEMSHPDLEIFSVEVPALTQTKTPDTMTDTDMLCELISALTGETVAADASPETKAAAFAKAKAAKPEAPTPEGMSAEAAAKIDALEKRLEKFDARETERDVDALITAATQAGKKIGLKRERLVAMGAEAAGEYLATLEAGQVKLSNNANVAEAGKGNAADPKPADVFSAETLAMFARNGLSPEKALERHKQVTALAAAEKPAAAGDDD
jgi:phage I-like protein